MAGNEDRRKDEGPEFAAPSLHGAARVRHSTKMHRMWPEGDGVQFFDLVEVIWKSASANASSARSCF